MNSTAGRKWNDQRRRAEYDKDLINAKAQAKAQAKTSDKSKSSGRQLGRLKDLDKP